MTTSPRLQLPDLGATALESLLERTHALLYAIDEQERILTVNKALRNRIDLELTALPDLRTFVRLLYPDPAFREAVLAAHRSALTGAPSRDVEWVLTSRQGDQRQIRWQFAAHGEAGSRVLVLVGEDVTDRRKLEQWVRLQNALLERIPEAVIVVDLEGRIIHWTGSAEKLFGYASRSALERPLSNILADESARGVALGWIEALRQEGQKEWVHALRRDTGDTLECKIQGARVQNERGQIVAIALVVTPVSGPVAAGPAESSEPALERALGQVASAAVVLTDAAGTVRIWGRGAERLGGMGANKAVGKRLLDEVMRSQGQSWEGLETRLASRGRFQAQFSVERPNGTRAPAEVDAHPLRGPDGAVVGVVCVFVDRSDLLALSEEALSTKTQALDGVFVEGVVKRIVDATAYFEPDHRQILSRLHDLRAIARMVGSGATMREFEAYTRRSRLVELDRELDDVMYRLGEGVHRLRTLVDDIGRFEAGEADPPGPVRITRELDAARELIAHHFENRIEIEYVLDDLPAARASRRPLLRGLVLLLLASAASCEGAERPQVVIEGRHQGGWLYLDCRDNGAGYSVDVQSRLTDLPYLAAQPGFAPLYLGLARESLRLAGGNLEIGSAAGTGARVRVSFPAADAAVAVQPVEVLSPTGVRRGRVLLVEDDDLLRRALERHVAEIHLVTSHTTIAEALGGLANEHYDAAVLGFPRPESFGLRLLARFAETAPSLTRNAIIMIPSGVKHATRERLVAQGWVVLPRPVDFTTLRSVLLRLMPSEELSVGDQ
ncbi:MAG: PAS domain S-box protein [Pseudomonadota bacterium]|nr:PAS domain S-box protein [Pseudomonadota bacterium]